MLAKSTSIASWGGAFPLLRAVYPCTRAHHTCRQVLCWAHCQGRSCSPKSAPSWPWCFCIGWVGQWEEERVTEIVRPTERWGKWGGGLLWLKYWPPVLHAELVLNVWLHHLYLIIANIDTWCSSTLGQQYVSACVTKVEAPSPTPKWSQPTSLRKELHYVDGCTYEGSSMCSWTAGRL